MAPFSKGTTSSRGKHSETFEEPKVTREVLFSLPILRRPDYLDRSEPLPLLGNLCLNIQANVNVSASSEGLLFRHFLLLGGEVCLVALLVVVHVVEILIERQLPVACLTVAQGRDGRVS